MAKLKNLSEHEDGLSNDSFAIRESVLFSGNLLFLRDKAEQHKVCIELLPFPLYPSPCHNSLIPQSLVVGITFLKVFSSTLAATEMVRKAGEHKRKPESNPYCSGCKNREVE